jgi:alpha-L-arabinofuranosidase
MKSPARRLWAWVALWLALAAAMLPSSLRAQSAGRITIDAAGDGHPIPRTLFGAFFEEINLAGDGGLYGELVRNRSFQNSANPDFWNVVARNTTGWVANAGNWSVDTAITPAVYRQGASGSDCRTVYAAPGTSAWSNYTLTLQARKLSGSEGFLVMFNVADAQNWFWWNVGGWSNATHAIQQCVDGTKTVRTSAAGSVITGQWYDLRVEVRDTIIRCYLDNVLKHTLTVASGYRGGIGLSTWNTQAEFRNIVVTGADTSVLYASDFASPASFAGDVAVDTGKPLNATNLESLRITMNSATGSVGAANSGYWGIPLKAGSSYDLSLHATAAAGSAGPLRVRLESADGASVYAQTSFGGLDASWRRFGAVFTPNASDANARLVVELDQPGTVWVDMVSLFPRETYRNRTNGLRSDLANAVAAMTPSFFRFPGGCFVEGRSMATAFRWKKSLGAVSERPGHAGYWDYLSTDGLGYHEYLLFCEDLRAAPIFCINAGISHSDVVPLDQMGEYVQDALDAIEYANGGIETTWGARRAAAGHPEPFNLKYIEIGNENGGANFNDRYALFHDAIRAKYPEIQLIVPVWGGTPSSRPFDLQDEHYYTNPQVMASYATKYDSYDRSGPKVFVGEYACTAGYGVFGNLAAALGEAAFMTGIERNCDVVEMAAYAPLFANVNMMTWKPDAIYFDNTRWFGTPAYHVQRMFANNQGSRLLPLTQDFSTERSGGVGFSTWNTQAEFRNVTVTGADTQVLYQSDFAAGTSGWTSSAGTWAVDASVTPAAYQQSASGTDCRVTYSAPGSAAWKDYTLRLQARKTGGSEGFLVMFYVADTDNWIWWNLGGWTNTSHAIEYAVAGAKATGGRVSGSIVTGRWYDIEIVVRGGTVSCYLDGVLTQSFELPSPVYSVASMKDDTREILLKTVNPSANAFSAEVEIAGTSAVGPNSTRLMMSSASPADENSLDAPDHVSPSTTSIPTPATSFSLSVPAYSVSVMRIQAPALAPARLTANAGNGRVTLGWESAAGAVSYTVKRATVGGGPYEVVASDVSGTSFIDVTPLNGTTYYYLITSVNAAGAVDSVETVSATPALPPITEDELRAPLIERKGAVIEIKVPSSTPGRAYSLQRSDDLANADWTDTGSVQIGAGGEVVFTDTWSPEIVRRFYRVKLGQ